jgi:hypothetical protein
MTTNTLTHKQGSTLFHFTTLKFWEPENTPPPTVREASDMIGLCFRWADKTSSQDEKEQAKAALVNLVRRWFPEWDGASLARRWGGKKKSAPKSSAPSASLPGFSPAPAAHPEPTKPAPADEPEPPADEDEADDQPEPANPAPADAEDTAEKIRRRIKAGINNLWLYGPAGTGKTTLCKMVAQSLGMPYTLLSCSAGTSPCEILGHKFPEPRPSPVSRAVGIPGIIVFDEITMLDASVAAVANALLANGEIETTTGHVIRHPECIIIATANTVGTGGDAQYIGNNQLDAATLDRFVGGMLKVDYSAPYESQYDSEVVRWVQSARAKCAALGLRRINSTRAIIAGHKLKAAGEDWKANLTEGWTDAERRAVGA